MASTTLAPGALSRAAHFVRRELRDSRILPFLLLLIGTDLLLCSLHLLHYFTNRFNHPNWNLTREKGTGEYFQYLKYLWCCWMLLTVFSRRREASDVAWAGLMAYLLLDDYKGMHEKTGRLIVERVGFEPWLGLRGQEFGELSYVLLVGSVIALVLVASYRYSGRRARADFAVLGALMFGMLVAAVGVDTLHILVLKDRILEPVLGMLEDGGEMIILSLMTVYCFHMALRSRDDRPEPIPG
ncbi:hypothetical protein ElP_22080 [Tautonia plasticadhaerens]|uniref:Uncharacterized protein n=2 Tax=Tautonia plasticadhaerens TaxID=2527974 RepID=A0A518H0H0_9BACT|nr:hypothetical protein ElP_22080 [Tautonia plasticadhaerens]